MEEITFWCRPSTASNSTVAGTKQAKRVKSARRKGRDKKRRQAWRDRRKSRTAAATVISDAAGAAPSSAIASSLSAPGSSHVSEPPAKRPKRSAAFNANRHLKGSTQRSLFPSPEQNRGGEGGKTADCEANISVDEAQERVEEPVLLPPQSPQLLDLPCDSPAPEGEEIASLDQTLEEGFDADFDEEVWEDGRRLNTCNPPWTSVFPVNSKRCRFCRRLPPEPDGDGDCLECDKYTTFQLVKKYAPRSRYPKEY